MINIIDTHCDALYKIQMARREEGRHLDFRTADELDTNLERLKQGGVSVQLFAIFLEPSIPSDEMWEYALEQIDIFQEEVIGKNPEMKHIKAWSDLDDLSDGEIGAILTLEGAEPIGNDLTKLEKLYEAGIMSIGLTWNPANLCADGVGESRGAGLTTLGKEVIKLNNKRGVLTDIAHLSMAGVDDVLQLADCPFASHCNARALYDHPRNLTDDQLKRLFEKGGHVHVVLYPAFIQGEKEATSIDDLIKHIDHLVSLGGEKQIGFGSDFDGIDRFITNLEDASQYQNLINRLLDKYSEEQVKGFAHENFLNFVRNI